MNNGSIHGPVCRVNGELRLGHIETPQGDGSLSARLNFLQSSARLRQLSLDLLVVLRSQFTLHASLGNRFCLRLLLACFSASNLPHYSQSMLNGMDPR